MDNKSKILIEGVAKLNINYNPPHAFCATILTIYDNLNIEK